MLPVQVEDNFLETLNAILLAALVSSAVVSVAFLWRLRFAKRERPSGSQIVSQLLMAAVVTLNAGQVLSWNLYLTSDTRTRLDLALFGASLMAVVCLWYVTRRLLGSSLRRRQVVDFSFSVVQTIGFGVCLQLFASPVHAIDMATAPPGRLVVEESCYAYTDQGSSIPLYRRILASGQFAEYVRLTQPQMAELTKFAMFRCDPASHTNCHGWVFTGGQFIVRDDDVELILNENRYIQVERPQMGDVVVYRNDRRDVIHTGKVCGWLHDQHVLVESKWGIGATYTHLVDVQPYSQHIEYWHSPRTGHALNIRQLDEHFQEQMLDALDD